MVTRICKVCEAKIVDKDKYRAARGLAAHYFYIHDSPELAAKALKRAK